MIYFSVAYQDCYPKAASDAEIRVGRGFSVVADEVRKLASDRASATVNITSVVEQIDQLINTIVSSLQRVSETAVESESNIQEVSMGLDEISRGVNQFVEMVEGFKPSTM